MATAPARGPRRRAPLTLRPHTVADLAWPSHSAALEELAVLLDLDAPVDAPDAAGTATLIASPRTPAAAAHVGTLPFREPLQPSEAADRLPPATRLTA